MIGKTRAPEGHWIVTRDKKPTELMITRDRAAGAWDLCTADDYILSGRTAESVMRQVSLILAKANVDG